MMKAGILLVLMLLIGACSTTSKVQSNSLVSENNKAAFILSILIRDYLRNTDARDFKLNDLSNIDSLGRIKENFEKIEMIRRGGHIAVKYKFSSSGNEIVLNNSETDLISRMNWRVKASNEKYDGEIQFAYGERFYYIRKIVILESSKLSNTK